MRIRLGLAMILVLILSILPLPDSWIAFKPSWLVLLALYLQFFLGEYFGVFILIFLAFSADILSTDLLGHHLFALTITSWLTMIKIKRFAQFNLMHQMVIIGILIFCYQFLFVFIDFIRGYPIVWLNLVLGPIVSALIWPWFKLLADDFLRVNSYVAQNRGIF